MAGRFLNLTFHGAGALTGEDLRLKEAAIASKLVSGDAMDEATPKTYFDAHRDELLLPKTAKPGDAAGMQIVSRNGFDVVTLNRVGRQAWARDPFAKVMGEWLRLVMQVPIDVLVLGGHHSKSFVWGSEARTPSGDRRAFCALQPLQDGTPKLAVVGYRQNQETDVKDLLRAGPVDMKPALSTCKLLIVHGCNGATKDIDKWRACIKDASGKFPFVLGWYGVHGFPRDSRGQFLSAKFWPELEKVAPGAAGSKNLDFVQNSAFTNDILKAWFNSCAAAFKAPPPKSKLLDQSHLIFSDFNSDGRPGPRGAGAIDPTGDTYKATDKNGNFV